LFILITLGSGHIILTAHMLTARMTCRKHWLEVGTIELMHMQDVMHITDHAGQHYCLIPSILLHNLEPSYCLMKNEKGMIFMTVQLL